MNAIFIVKFLAIRVNYYKYEYTIFCNLRSRQLKQLKVFKAYLRTYFC